MDFIDNLLNHMSSKFNQESALPKQAEISMDETFKWRSLKNNQFASRSKNGRSSKNKLKDKDKYLAVDAYPSNISETNVTDVVTNTEGMHDNNDIEIEIANDISGVEIQEVLASTQGILPIVEETNDSIIRDVNSIEIINSATIEQNEAIIVVTETVENSVDIHGEIAAMTMEEEGGLTQLERDVDVQEKNNGTFECIDGIQESVSCTEDNTATHNTMEPSAETNILVHMSSTFNSTNAFLRQPITHSEDEGIKRLVTHKESVRVDEKCEKQISIDACENKDDISSTVEKDNIVPTLIRRSKRLKHEHGLAHDASATSYLPKDCKKTLEDTEVIEVNSVNIGVAKVSTCEKFSQPNVTDSSPEISLSMDNVESKSNTNKELKNKNDIALMNEPIRNLRSMQAKRNPSDTIKLEAVSTEKELPHKSKNDLKLRYSQRKTKIVNSKKKHHIHQQKVIKSSTRAAVGKHVMLGVIRGKKIRQVKRTYATRQANVNASLQHSNTNVPGSSKGHLDIISHMKVKDAKKPGRKSKVLSKSQGDIKNINKKPSKRSQRLSRDGSDGILASAIARREKNDVAGFHGRLSRPIKLSAKILANDELRHGFELQNNVRLCLNTDPKLSSETNAPKTAFLDILVDQELTTNEGQFIAGTEKTPALPPETKDATSVHQKKCRDPNDFLHEIKQQNWGNNKSPEYNSKLNKSQYKKLLKLKEKTLWMLGLRKIDMEKTSLDTTENNSTTLEKEELMIDKNMVAGNIVLHTSSSENVATAVEQQLNEDVVTREEEAIETIICTNQTNHEKDTEIYASITSLISSPANTLSIPRCLNIQSKTKNHETYSRLSAKLICHCQKRTRYFTTKTQNRMFCTATDDINGRLIGCSEELKGELQNLLRTSSKASYQLLCHMHRKRLKHHGCCASCGVYCTQGSFAICPNKHLFHWECAEKFVINSDENSSPITPKLLLKCPHCGQENPRRNFKIALDCYPSLKLVTSRNP